MRRAHHALQSEEHAERYVRGAVFVLGDHVLGFTLSSVQDRDRGEDILDAALGLRRQSRAGYPHHHEDRVSKYHLVAVPVPRVVSRVEKACQVSVHDRSLDHLQRVAPAPGLHLRLERREKRGEEHLRLRRHGIVKRPNHRAHASKHGPALRRGNLLHVAPLPILKMRDQSGAQLLAQRVVKRGDVHEQVRAVGRNLSHGVQRENFHPLRRESSVESQPQRRPTPRERAQILEEQQRNLGPRVERRDLRALPRGRRRDRRRVRLEAREHVESRLTRSRRGGGAHALVLRPKHPHARGHRGGRRRLVLDGLDERECALHALEPGNVPARVGLGRFRDGPGERPRLLGGQGAIGEKLLREAHGGRGDVRVSRRTRQLDGSEDVLLACYRRWIDRERVDGL
mmetsp:Transcript_12440/g.53504  ORF Transcript_12440/g.53504 Transcript_12440/m.53504 type:complete len:398 (-) Transcript_12440:240-1433(-)